MKRFYNHWATIAAYSFIDGLALWLLQRFSFGLHFSYWQCFWVGAVLAFILMPLNRIGESQMRDKGEASP